MAVVPVVVIVLILFFTYLDIDNVLLYRFLIGALLVMIGMAIFLSGAEIAIEEIGINMGRVISKLKTLPSMFLFGSFLGFLITVVEPDLMILAKQVESATGGVISTTLTVIVVALGVGVMVGFGFLRILKDFPINKFFTIFYAIAFLLFFFTMEEFHGMSFDASGATTGTMTTPFLLALALGVSSLKGSKGSDDSFGLVGIASVGPVIAVLMMSFFVKEPTSMPISVESTTAGMGEYLLNAFIHSVKDTFYAIIPLILIFLIFNKFIFKLTKREFMKIIFGLIYTFVGLVIFLTGVSGGFMSLAQEIGMEISKNNPWLLPFIGFIFGMVIVTAEPAVYVLSTQVEDVTGGSISRRMIMVTLCIGVAIAVCLSMVRMLVPGVKLWMFLSVGFLASLILSYRIPKIFVGIAFDSGGVASGPMTATFLLALNQGAASQIPTADLLIHGFGVIALVAMMPVISISVLGLIYKIKAQKAGVNIE